MKRRDLSGEERELWALATRDVKPAKKQRRRPPVRDAVVRSPPKDESARKPAIKAVAPKTAPPIGALKERVRAAPRDAQKSKTPPAFGGGDPKADRKAAKGIIPIEARIDLHGLTEPAAHARVMRFILGAREDGLRLVLVITGKGARAGGEGRGVIRARFMDWIETAPLRAAIARVATAKPKDGGAGAFYVFLKRKTRG